MSGLSAKLPLAKDSGDGWKLTQDLKELSIQNFKMVLLTNPGERIMNPDFGVGIRTYLFEPATSETLSQIQSKIQAQVKKYMPYIRLKRIDFSAPEGQYALEEMNLISIQIQFVIIPINKNVSIEISTGGVTVMDAANPVADFAETNHIFA